MSSFDKRCIKNSPIEHEKQKFVIAHLRLCSLTFLAAECGVKRQGIFSAIIQNILLTLEKTFSALITHNRELL
jgi:hypothetical protein